jgi:hypothetical protein
VDGLMTRSRAAALDDALAAELSASAPPAAVATELALAHRLHDAGAALAPVPSAEFREALRTRLLAVAAVQGVGRTAPSPAPAAVSWRTRAATVAAGITATAVAASGVAVASSRALPGDPFYGVKRTTEALQLKVAGGHEAEGTRHLQFATARLAEVRALVLGREAPADAVATATVPADVEDDVRDPLADMDVDTRTGLALMVSAFRATRSTDPLEQMSRFAAAQGDGLRAVLPALTGPGRLQALKSLTLVQDMQAEADELLMLVDCTAVCDPAQVAPVAPAPGQPAPPCGCPTPVPPPQTAPPPPAPSSDPPPTTPADPDPGSPSDPGPGTPPSTSPPPPSQQPEPGPGLPGLPLPSPPPLPTVPGVEVPTLPLDSPLPGVAPAVLPAGGGLRALVDWLLSR